MHPLDREMVPSATPIDTTPRGARGVLVGVLVTLALVGAVVLARCSIGPDFVETALPVIASQDWMWNG